MSSGEEMFGRLVLVTTDGIIITDSLLKIILWNKGAKRIFRLSTEELDDWQL